MSDVVDSYLLTHGVSRCILELKGSSEIFVNVDSTSFDITPFNLYRDKLMTRNFFLEKIKWKTGLDFKEFHTVVYTILFHDVVLCSVAALKSPAARVIRYKQID